MKKLLIIILVFITTSIKPELVKIINTKSAFSYELSSLNELDASTHINDLFENLNNSKASNSKVAKFLDLSSGFSYELPTYNELEM